MAKILVVEQENSLLKEWIAALGKANHTISGALDYSDAISKLELRNYDLIIADLIGNGMESSDAFLTKIILQLAKTPCNVLVTSKELNFAASNVMKSSRLFHFFPKPFYLDALLQKIELVLTSREVKEPVRPIDVKFINPVLQATIDAISIMTGSAVQAKTPYIKRPGETTEDVTGQVAVVSTGFVGNISLSFPEVGYIKMVSKVLGTDYTEVNDENRDFIAELMNMIFGQAKLKLNESGMNIQSAIPQVIIGRTSGDPTTTGPVLVIPFSCSEFGYCKVEISSRSP